MPRPLHQVSRRPPTVTGREEHALDFSCGTVPLDEWSERADERRVFADAAEVGELAAG